MAALESQLAAMAEGAEAAAAERRRRSLRRLLRQAVVLRRTVVADGLVAADTEGAEAAEEDACWEGAGGEISEGDGTGRGSEDEQAAEEEFVEKAHARYAYALAPVSRHRAVSAFRIIRIVGHNTLARCLDRVRVFRRFELGLGSDRPHAGGEGASCVRPLRGRVHGIMWNEISSVQSVFAQQGSAPGTMNVPESLLLLRSETLVASSHNASCILSHFALALLKYVPCIGSCNDGRLAWLENHIGQTPLPGVSAVAATAPTVGNTSEESEPQESDETAPRDTFADDGVPAEDALASGEDGGSQPRVAGTSPPLAWASPGEEEGEEGGGGGAMADDEDGGDGEVERLWCRMHKVENRIYQRRADSGRLQVRDVEHGGGEYGVAVMVGLVCDRFLQDDTPVTVRLQTISPTPVEPFRRRQHRSRHRRRPRPPRRSRTRTSRTSGILSRAPRYP